MATSPRTLIRNVLASTLGGDATIRTLCGRATGCVAYWSGLQSMVFPIILLMLPSVQELDGVGDPRSVLAILSAQAEGSGAVEVAEALAQRAEELVGALRLTGAGLELLPEDVSSQDITDPALVPAGRARVDVTIRYRAEVG